MTLYLKGHQKYSRSKLKFQNLLNKNKSFNFDLSYFCCPLRYRVMQYLIIKLRLVVNLSLEGQGVVALFLVPGYLQKSNFITCRGTFAICFDKHCIYEISVLYGAV